VRFTLHEGQPKKPTIKHASRYVIRFGIRHVDPRCTRKWSSPNLAAKVRRWPFGGVGAVERVIDGAIPTNELVRA